MKVRVTAQVELHVRAHVSFYMLQHLPCALHSQQQTELWAVEVIHGLRSSTGVMHPKWIKATVRRCPPDQVPQGHLVHADSLVWPVMGL